MLNGLKNVGCPFHWQRHTNIAECPDSYKNIGGFYDYERRQIVVCKNYWESNKLKKYAFLEGKIIVANFYF